MLTQSPGNRLSHLAKRRAIFSSANLATNSIRLNNSMGPQILLDKKYVHSHRSIDFNSLYSLWTFRKERNKRKATPKRKTPGSKKKSKCSTNNIISNWLTFLLQFAKLRPLRHASASFAPISSSRDPHVKLQNVRYSKAPQSPHKSSCCSHQSRCSSQRLPIAWRDPNVHSSRPTMDKAAAAALAVSWRRCSSESEMPAMTTMLLILRVRAANYFVLLAMVWRRVHWRLKVRAFALELVPPQPCSLAASLAAYSSRRAWGDLAAA